MSKDIGPFSDQTCNHPRHEKIDWETSTWIHSYQGDYLHGCEHGDGVFTWNFNYCEKVVYEGKFYANNLNGYGRVSYPTNAVFEGLFKENIRFGPGIFTYSDGKQDIGLWDSRNLIRLSQKVYPEWVPQMGRTQTGKLKLLRFRTLVNIKDDPEISATKMLKSINASPDVLAKADLLYNDTIRDPNSTFFNKNSFDNAFYNHRDELKIKVVIPNDKFGIKISECGISLTEAAIGGVEEEEALSDLNPETKCVAVTDLIAWNNSRIFVNILKHTFMNRDSEFAPYINKVLLGDRQAFRCTGPLEEFSVFYLECCSNGLDQHINNLIYKYRVFQDVCDSRGNCGLIYAVARDCVNVINVLGSLNVNANLINDEGLTALSLAVLRYIAVKESITDWEAAFLPECDILPTRSEDQVIQEWNAHTSFISEPWICDQPESNLPHNFTSTNPTAQLAYDQISLKPQTFIFDYRPIIQPKCGIPKPKKGPKIKSEKRLNIVTRKSEVNQSDGVENRLEVIESIINLLIKYRADPNLCVVPYPLGIIAIFTKKVTIVEALLKANTDPNCRADACYGGLTALHVMCSCKPFPELIDLVPVYLKYGANPDLRANPEHWRELRHYIDDPDVPDDDLGLTPLHSIAIRHDWVNDASGYLTDLARILLDHRANPDLIYAGHTPLSLAMLNGRLALIRQMFETNKVNPNQKLAPELGVPLTIFFNPTYLEILTLEQQKDVMRLIVENGANPFDEVHDDVNVLEYVAMNRLKKNPQSRSSSKASKRPVSRCIIKDQKPSKQRIEKTDVDRSRERGGSSSKQRNKSPKKRSKASKASKARNRSISSERKGSPKSRRNKSSSSKSNRSPNGHKKRSPRRKRSPKNKRKGSPKTPSDKSHKSPGRMSAFKCDKTQSRVEQPLRRSIFTRNREQNKQQLREINREQNEQPGREANRTQIEQGWQKDMGRERSTEQGRGEQKERERSTEQGRGKPNRVKNQSNELGQNWEKNEELKGDTNKEEKPVGRRTAREQGKLLGRQIHRYTQLVAYLHQLANYTLEQNIIGRAVRRLYKIFDTPLEERHNQLCELHNVVQLPKFEKTVDVFVKMSEHQAQFKRNQLKLLLDYSLERDFLEPCETQKHITKSLKSTPKNPSNSLNARTQTLLFQNATMDTLVTDTTNPENDRFVSQPNVEVLAGLIAKIPRKQLGEDSPGFFYPEYDLGQEKYNVCFECHARKGVVLISCPVCCLVQFCSQKCNLKSIEKETVHKCKDVFWNRVYESLNGIETSDDANGLDTRTDDQSGKLKIAKEHGVKELTTKQRLVRLAKEKGLLGLVKEKGAPGLAKAKGLQGLTKRLAGENALLGLTIQGEKSNQIRTGLVNRGNLGEVCDKYAAYMLQVAGAVDFDKMVFPYCAYRDGNLYYRLFCENCLFIENYSLI